MEARRWKAFLRLEGETLVNKDADILDEFKGFVQALKRAGIDYSIVVNVEERGLEKSTGRPGQAESMTQGSTRRTERVGG